MCCVQVPRLVQKSQGTSWPRVPQPKVCAEPGVSLSWRISSSILTPNHAWPCLAALLPDIPAQHPPLCPRGAKHSSSEWQPEEARLDSASRAFQIQESPGFSEQSPQPISSLQAFCTCGLQRVGAALGFAGGRAASTGWLSQKRHFTSINYKRVS